MEVTESCVLTINGQTSLSFSPSLLLGKLISNWGYSRCIAPLLLLLTMFYWRYFDKCCDRNGMETSRPFWKLWPTDRSGHRVGTLPITKKLWEAIDAQQSYCNNGRKSSNGRFAWPISIMDIHISCIVLCLILLYKSNILTSQCNMYPKALH